MRIKTAVAFSLIATTIAFGESRNFDQINQSGIAEKYRVNFTRSASERSLALEFLEKRKEVILCITVTAKEQIDTLATFLSVDKVEGFRVTAYVNVEQFQQFEKLNLPYEVQIPESLRQPENSTRATSDYLNFNPFKDSISTFPSYNGYLNLMKSFVTAAPSICRLQEIGKSYDGRSIEFLVMSDSVNVDQAEPKVRVGSTIHGDETVGMIVYLKMIQNMIRNYKTDPEIARLIDSTEMWICPDLNPDGTYGPSQGAGQTGATRGNSKGTDLNRSFPGPSQINGNYLATANEMIILKDFELKNRFTVGTDCHGGMEGIVMPWSYQLGIPAPSNRAVWADLATKLIPGFQQIFVSENGPYAAAGTQFDFAYYAYGGIILCPEVSDRYKMIQAGTFQKMYDQFAPGTLTIIGEALNGVRGTITDAVTGTGIEASVKLSSIDDAKYGAVKSYPDFGDYYHLATTGTYSVTISPKNKSSYKDTVITAVKVKTGAPTILNVSLRSTATSVLAVNSDVNPVLSAMISNGFLKISLDSREKIKSASLFSANGRKVLPINLMSQTDGYEGIVSTSELSKGVYVFVVETNSSQYTCQIVNK